MTTILSSFANLGGPGTIILLMVVLLLFGAKRLPELARGLGQAINEFNKAKDDVQRQIARADEPAVRRPDELQEHRPAAPAPAPAPVAAAPAAAPAPAPAPVAAAPAPAAEQSVAAAPEQQSQPPQA